MQTKKTVSSTRFETSGAVIRFPYDITFVDCEPSTAVRFQVEEHLSKVDQIYDRITDCKVAVRIPHKHSHNRFFHIHLQLDVPGRRLVVSRDPESVGKKQSIQTAIHDAFHKLTRQLEDFLELRHAHAGKKLTVNYN